MRLFVWRTAIPFVCFFTLVIHPSRVGFSSDSRSENGVTAGRYFESLKAARTDKSPKAAVTLSVPVEKEKHDYPVRAGDKLNIQVYRETDLSGKFIVDFSGNINLPLIGEVLVQGLSLDEVTKLLEDRLGKDYLIDPQVQVSFEESLNKSVSILGQVSKSGNYDFTEGMTIVRLISEAGGFTGLAAPKHVRITRSAEDGTKKTLVVNVDAIMNGRAEDVLLESGDLIMVPETYF